MKAQSPILPLTPDGIIRGTSQPEVGSRLAATSTVVTSPPTHRVMAPQPRTRSLSAEGRFASPFPTNYTVVGAGANIRAVSQHGLQRPAVSARFVPVSQAELSSCMALGGVVHRCMPDVTQSGRRSVAAPAPPGSFVTARPPAASLRQASPFVVPQSTQSHPQRYSVVNASVRSLSPTSASSSSAPIVYGASCSSSGARLQPSGLSLTASVTDTPQSPLYRGGAFQGNSRFVPVISTPVGLSMPASFQGVTAQHHSPAPTAGIALQSPRRCLSPPVPDMTSFRR